MHECIFIMNVFMVALCTMIVCRGFFLCMDCHVPIFMNVLRQNIMGMFFLTVYSYPHVCAADPAFYCRFRRKCHTVRCKSLVHVR